MRRWSCLRTGSPSWPTRGGIRFRRWPRPAIHVLAPNQRGYGGSSTPEAVEAYTVVELVRDIVGLLDEVGAERAAIVGHDFGARGGLGCAAAHPDRSQASSDSVARRCRGRRCRRPRRSAGVFGDNFFYILYFQEPGPADAELNRDPATTMRRLMGGMAVDRRRSRSDADADARPRRVTSSDPGARRAARVDQPGRVRPLHRRIHPRTASPPR